jgi:hypothetical protein
MNLVNGEILETSACAAILDDLENRMIHTLTKGSLPVEIVLNACDKLVSNLDTAAYLAAMAELGIDGTLGTQYLEEARWLFSRESLMHRLYIEFGADSNSPRSYVPFHKRGLVTEKIVPLGVLLHIAAGNADGLPAFSVLEGLLTGNINILKLPAAEGGISVRLLRELTQIEPQLADYIYVFDYSSKDIEQIGKLIGAADAVVVWGGTEAVSAIRRLVPPHIRLIEWGHKISFAYVTRQGITESALQGLAHNMVTTGQLLCSSMQGIFVDAADMQTVHDFCAAFLPILEDTIRRHSNKIGIEVQAQVALRLYNAQLEGIYQPRRIFKGEGCSLIAYSDRALETAIQFGNAWVKPLPRDELVAVLRPYKNILQTVGLLCGDAERAEITERLFKTGVVRVCSGEDMSIAYCGMPHDGEYPLRRYTKVVSAENSVHGNLDN